MARSRAVVRSGRVAVPPGSYGAVGIDDGETVSANLIGADYTCAASRRANEGQSHRGAKQRDKDTVLSFDTPQWWQAYLALTFR